MGRCWREDYPSVSSSAEFSARIEKRSRLRSEADRRESWEPPETLASCGVGFARSAGSDGMSAMTWWIADSITSAKDDLGWRGG